jgi:hypothetical protein
VPASYSDCGDRLEIVIIIFYDQIVIGGRFVDFDVSVFIDRIIVHFVALVG